MSRFTPEEKHKFVQRYLNGRISYRTLAKEVGVDNSVLRYWVKLYEYHGDDAFAFPYTNYPSALKLEVIQFMNETDYSVREAAALFHIPDFSMVRRWKKKWERGGTAALEPSGKGPNRMAGKKKADNDKMKEMEKELEYLRMENAYLKKLKALVQEKEASRKKKKR